MTIVTRRSRPLAATACRTNVVSHFEKHVSSHYVFFEFYGGINDSKINVTFERQQSLYLFYLYNDMVTVPLHGFHGPELQPFRQRADECASGRRALHAGGSDVHLPPGAAAHGDPAIQHPE